MHPAENYILEQEEPFKSILVHLQVVIERTIPEASLKFKYRVPFYYIEDRPFCYLNRAKNKNYIDLGFWNAAHLTVYQEFMTTAGRKMMKSLRYFNLEGIDETILVAVLNDAYTVRDKKFYK